MLKHISIAAILCTFTVNTYAFLNQLPTEATASGMTSLSEKLSKTDPKTELLTQKLEDVGLTKPADQANWTNFVQDCIIKDKLSPEKISSLLHADLNGIQTFIKNFDASTHLKTIINDNIITCKHAQPLVQKMIGALTEK